MLCRGAHVGPGASGGAADRVDLDALSLPFGGAMMGSRGPVKNAARKRAAGDVSGSGGAAAGGVEGLKAPPNIVKTDADAFACWRRLVKEAAKVPGHVWTWDRELASVYCLAWADVVRSEKAKRADGFSRYVVGAKGSLKPHPEFEIGNKARQQLVQAGDKLGLSPAARARIEVATHKEQVDPLAELQREARSAGVVGRIGVGGVAAGGGA